jgi:quinol monooxygenase YgiN
MRAFAVVVASALMSAAAVLTARARAPAPPAADPAALVYVIGYIDVVTPAKAQAMTLLKQFRTACAREDGNQRCEIVQRMEQQNEFVTLEIWKDQAAFKAHAAGAGAQLRERLKTLLASPYDERVHTGFSVLPPRDAPGGRGV